MQSDAPPSYSKSEGTSQKKVPSSTAHDTTNGIPDQERRSMEDLTRPLPEGWIRQFDSKSHHHFYVNTRETPPRSIWQHPSDENPFENNKGGGSGERERHQQNKQYELDSTTDEEGAHQSSSTSNPKGIKKLGQTMKNKMTNSTHAERVAKRKQQREIERKAYEQHQEIRNLLSKATQTGEPQLVGKDKSGRDIYAQPPPTMDPYAGAQLGYTPYQTPNQYGGYGYSAPGGMYGRRGYGGGGYGYGGGMGMPMMMGGGLAGGMLMGGLLF
ncbi:hypothetical protein CBS101457_002474 [Exobasidium rhododendri]|nr:hypothetical protein CBS101457_002474 [Exobasidium rhododendri]